MIGANVTLAVADVFLMPVGLVLSGLAVTDPTHPMTNAIEVARLSLELEGRDLFRRKIIITTMAGEGIRVGAPREESGAVVKNENSMPEEGSPFQSIVGKNLFL